MSELIIDGKVNVAKARQVLYRRWFLNGFAELDDPMDTEEYCYIAVLPESADYTDDFDFLFWEPAILALEEEVAKNEDRTFYKVDVFYEDDKLCIISSRGKFPQLPKPESTIEYDELVKYVFKTGGGVIPGCDHLGVFASTQENVGRCPPGWIFVDMATATLDILQEAVNTAKEGRANWPKQD